MYTFNDGVITGETTNNYFGYSLVSGDFNADGKTDLAVGANTYSTSTGRAYLFYNDGSIPTTAATADVIITGEASSQFGFAMSSGDFNADGKTDLVVGAVQYSSYTGRAYLFYNDGSIPTTAATADVIITGAANDSIGGAFSPGDFNFDGKTDLAVLGAGLAKVFLFYNDGSIPTTSATADVKITGFGIPSGLASGDFNADGRVDLAIGDIWQSSGDYTGKTYLFYNDGSIPTTPGTADLTITGETTNNYFGATLVSGDFNFDGKTDLAIGAYRYGSYDGRAYIFYNDGSIPTTAATADVIISSVSGAGSYFGNSLASGDFNADGKTDLAIGAQAYSSNTGRTYLFYNDGSIPTTAASADVIIIGPGSQNFLGCSLAPGDFNSDGKTDLAIGSYLSSSSTGRAYIFMTEAKAEEALLQLQSIGVTNIIGNFEVR
jgi:formylmethanofuran dehydrogenase subunit C